MMEENDIVILDNDQKYALIREFTDGVDKYFVAALVKENDEIDKTKLVALKVIKSSDGDYVEIVEDVNKLKNIYKKMQESSNK